MRRMALKEIFLAALIVVWIAACKPATSRLSEELGGVWTTSEPKYAGRFLQLAGERIVFGTAEGYVSVYTITAIRESPQADGLLYTITYASEDMRDYQWSFVYDRERAVIWFNNQQDIVWRKRAP
jgi:hypothetical protein